MTLSDDEIAKLLARARTRVRQHRATQLLPLYLPGPEGAPCHGPSLGPGEIASGSERSPCTWEKDGNRLRLRIPGNKLPGTPLALVVGPEFRFWKGGVATGQIEFPLVSLADQLGHESDSAGGRLVASGVSLRADDGEGNPVTEQPKFTGESKEVAWCYHRDEDVFSVEATAPGHKQTMVVMEMQAADDPDFQELRLLPLKGPRTLAGLLKSNHGGLPFENYGPQVKLSVGPVDPSNPRHVSALLAQASFVSLPLELQPDGSYLADCRAADQQIAVQEPDNAWAVLTSVVPESEVPS